MSTWFTLKRMKTVAITIITFDIILLLSWLSGAIYLVTKLDTHCYESQFTNHFFILIHFALALCITGIVDEIEKEELKHENKEITTSMPYQFYSPFSWIFTSILSLFGDIILLAAASHEYNTMHEEDECTNARIMHITLDVIALIISVISIIWFILFSFYTIKPQRRKSMYNNNTIPIQESSLPLYNNPSRKFF